MRKLRIAAAGIAAAAVATFGMAGSAQAAEQPTDAQPAKASVGLDGMHPTVKAGGSVAGNDVSVQQAPACGFTWSFTDPIWNNCTDQKHRITVVGFNSAGPGSPGKQRTICVGPGVTHLYPAIAGEYFIMHSRFVATC